MDVRVHLDDEGVLGSLECTSMHKVVFAIGIYVVLKLAILCL